MAKRLLLFASFLFLACPAVPGPSDGGTDGGSLQPPELTSLTPTRGSQAGGTLVTLNGTGFSEGIQVFFGGLAGTDVLLASRAKLTVRTPATLNVGAVEVKVQNRDGQSARLPGAFTFESETNSGIDEALILNPLEGHDTSGSNPLAVSVVAHVSVPGLTSGAGQAPGVTGQVGYATTLSSPPSMTDFTWVNASYSGDADGPTVLDKRFDVYRADVMLPGAMGAEEKVFYLGARFTTDSVNWTLVDRDGVTNGLQPTQVPKVTVSRPTVDWCKMGGQIVEAPPDLNLKTGQAGPVIYAQLYSAGITDQAGVGAGLKAELGYGAVGSAVSTWTWANATFNVDTGGGANDEFQATLPNPGLGTYSFAYRVTLNDGPARYCDANGLAEGGFTADQTGKLTVTGMNIDECKVLGPALAVTVPSGMTVPISARVLATTVTEANGQGANISAEIGYGAQGSAPSTWTTWTSASYASDQGTYDLYQKVITAPSAAGTYDVAFRFGLAGQPLVYCDLDGSANGYSAAQAAHLSVGAAQIQSCKLFSVDKTTAASGTSVVAHGRVVVPGVTEASGAQANVRAQVGVGSANTDASALTGWGWKEASFSSDVGSSNEDDFVATFNPAYTGNRAVSFRFSTDNGTTWAYCDLNGSDVGGYQIDQQHALAVTPAVDPTFCNTQFPATLNLADGGSGVVYGRVYQAGVTDAPGAHATMRAELGFTPSAQRGADPGVSAQWTWFAADYNTQVVNDDEYQATFGPADAGTYTYAFRFTRTDGGSYCFGDLDGAGSAGGFNGENGMADNLGQATVLP